ncbi:GNAT family N-acetyltransferase [Aquibacillus salsiterrae]|uniref:GNAT family N-acetyltransferase n=1 Tax=Aquibacillus salsiterrae TaxID=2950439 RepID=A0A9X3WHL0_9BACI|nr:GNAT family N-acetyltransferase [Aquibacillus salsiterrae]MDC3417181.1 GNAT family N-acetyltransferase [Aquibacillus salsiterrae]
METYIVETEKQLKDAYQVRNTVFVKEQKVPPELEIDDLEKEAIHFVGYHKEKPIAAGRLRIVDNYGKLERVCVLKEFRGQSFGKTMIRNMEQTIVDNGKNKAKLNAQTHAESFYQSLGYDTVSDEFIDAGIPHVTMVKEL